MRLFLPSCRGFRRPVWKQNFTGVAAPEVDFASRRRTTPFAKPSGETSFKAQNPSRLTCAMPAPMRPAPNTATEVGSFQGRGSFAAVMPSNSPISADDSLFSRASRRRRPQREGLKAASRRSRQLRSKAAGTCLVVLSTFLCISKTSPPNTSSVAQRIRHFCFFLPCESCTAVCTANASKLLDHKQHQLARSSWPCPVGLLCPARSWAALRSTHQFWCARAAPAREGLVSLPVGLILFSVSRCHSSITFHRPF